MNLFSLESGLRPEVLSLSTLLSYARKLESEGRATGLGERRIYLSADKTRLVNTRQSLYLPDQAPSEKDPARRHLFLYCSRESLFGVKESPKQGSLQLTSPVAKTGPNQSSRSWCWIDSIPSTLPQTVVMPILAKCILCPTVLPPSCLILPSVFKTRKESLARPMEVRTSAYRFRVERDLFTLRSFWKSDDRGLEAVKGMLMECPQIRLSENSPRKIKVRKEISIH